MRRSLTALIILVGSICPVTSRSAHYGEGVIFGEGNITCAQWVQSRSMGTSDLDEAWVRGLMSGMNLAESIAGQPGNIGKTSDPAGNNLWIDNYCKDHQLSKLAEAALLLRVVIVNPGIKLK